MGIRSSTHDLGNLLRQQSYSGLTITVCDKEATLGIESFRQFWLKNSSVYGGRRTFADNREAILGFFHRAAVQQGGGADHHSAGETWLLASLASEIRSNKAQEVFPDASFSNCSSGRRHRQITDLDALLSAAINDERNCNEFYHHSRNVCELADMLSEVVQEYLRLESQLYEGVLDGWVEEPEICEQLVRERWRDWMYRARRSSCRRDFKDVLNILSYESKAALHQCYSLLWVHLAGAFAEQEGSNFVNQFHRFWHCDYRVPTDGVHDMHLLHGHIFGLHPAFALMIQTATGGGIIADAVGNHLDSREMRTFFAAGIVSLNFYMSERIENRRRL